MRRRKSERVPYYVEIILEYSSGKRETRISDISTGGCYIDSISAVKPGENVAFELKQAIGGSLRFTGTVAYVLEGFGFGIQFTDLSDQHKAVIQQILTSR